nr:hypothetical protein [Tanacetum cinerariifolium]
VIPTTSVSRPQLKSNRLEDRAMHNNSEEKKQQVEDHRRNFKFFNNKTFVTACNDSLNAKTSNVNFVCVTCGKCVLNDNHDMCVLQYINGVNSRTKMHMTMPISNREPKRTVNQSATTPLKITVAAESTNQKPKSTIRKQYVKTSKTCRWWYCKITPPRYEWKPKSRTVNVEPNVSMPLGTKSRTTNISEPTTPRDGENLDKMKEKGSLSLGPQSQENVPHTAETVTTLNELDFPFSLIFDELLNGTTQVVSKSFVATTVDAPNQRQQLHLLQKPLLQIHIY